MFKKFTATLLISALTQVYAITPIQQSLIQRDDLKRSIDELNYKVNVEWDQKDQKALNLAIADFEKDIKDLMSQGMKNDELIKVSLEKIQDQKVRAEILDMLSTINENQMGSDEVKAFVLSKLNEFYAKGTSWSGRRHGHMGVIIAVLVLIICCNQHSGKAGPPGPAGPQGPQGPQGDPGEDGGVYVCNLKSEPPFGPPPFCFPPSTK